jgi:hypothetical protein
MGLLATLCPDVAVCLLPWTVADDGSIGKRVAVQIADFGLAVSNAVKDEGGCAKGLWQPDTEPVIGGVGTYSYMAPEYAHTPLRPKHARSEAPACVPLICAEAIGSPPLSAE